MSSRMHCFGALALEVGPGGGPRWVIGREAAERLAAGMARDLACLLPGAEALDGVFAAALFDPAELLRPGWPVHAALAALAEGTPGRAGGRVIAVGGCEGRMPVPALQPDPAFAQGALRLLPFTLVGPAEQVDAVAQCMERDLLETGMASAETALEAGEAFGLALEHVRYLSLHDLCALTCAQYEHFGLADAWRLVEAALLAPATLEWLERPDGLTAVQERGRVRVIEADETAWQALGAEGSFRAYRAALEQLVAILAAHGVPVQRVGLVEGGRPREQLERAGPSSLPVERAAER
ncbi:MAG: hypothetical protein KatS3mg126_1851 [Lysobacteraceae bacterium]|nr:MAG: hypothetical protein KatS3mg126_1851 [Xanthomonadaceae bacterium]